MARRTSAPQDFGALRVRGRVTGSNQINRIPTTRACLTHAKPALVTKYRRPVQRRVSWSARLSAHCVCSTRIVSMSSCLTVILLNNPRIISACGPIIFKFNSRHRWNQTSAPHVGVRTLVGWCEGSAVGSAVNQILAANERAPTGTCHRGWTAVGKRASLFDQTVTEEESSDVGDVWSAGTQNTGSR